MDVFVISPASARPLWFVAVICVIIAAVFFALAYTAYSSRHSRVEMSSDGLKLVGDFWGREIPLSRLNIPAVRILDISGKTEYSPRRRTFGTGLPGYASGWFRLRNGEKALLYLTKREKVVYLPTHDGYSLLLSVDEAERFIDTLHRHGSV